MSIFGSLTSISHFVRGDSRKEQSRYCDNKVEYRVSSMAALETEDLSSVPWTCVGTKIEPTPQSLP